MDLLGLVDPTGGLSNSQVIPPPHTPTPRGSDPRDSIGSSPVLLSPITPTLVRARSPSLISATSGDDYESSDDSVLSWWSSDDDSEGGDDGGGDDGGVSDAEVDESKELKEAERKRREAERQKILSAAGLQIRREPPGIPYRGGGGVGTERKVSRRRPAPVAPEQKHQQKQEQRNERPRRKAPAVPTINKTGLDTDTDTGMDAGSVITPPDQEEQDQVEDRQDPMLETQDAYARYEQFLAESKSRPNPVVPAVPVGSPADSARPDLQAFSPSTSGPSIISPTASHGTLAMGGGKDSASASNRLSGFFSRMMAPSTGQQEPRRVSPLISGPITRVDDSRTSTPVGGGGGGETELGKTWGSLVDPGVLESMGDQERKRQEAIFEFIATEAAYNRDLQLIVQVFYASLLDMDILDDKALTVIFANVEDILLANTSFLSSLEQRQKSCRLYIDIIGDVLSEHMPAMGVYTTYCVNQSQASRLLQSLRQSNPTLSLHLSAIREDNESTRGLDLSSYLLIPMQRITRYPLLLKQIIHYTAADQDLVQVQHALHTVEGIVSMINEDVREAEGQERLHMLSEDLWIGGEG